MLFELQYSLANGIETIVINGETIPLSTLSIITKYSSKILARTHDSLITTFKKKYPSLFSSPCFNELLHDYNFTIKLKDFPYTKTRVRYSSAAAAWLSNITSINPLRMVYLLKYQRINTWH